MMGRQAAPEPLFYDFRLDDHVPANHLLRKIDVFVDLESIRQDLKPFYSQIGRPSVDPELMIRMLIIGYCYGIRSERRLCEDVDLNLAFRWFCRLDLYGRVPDQFTFFAYATNDLIDTDIALGLAGGERQPGPLSSIVAYGAAEMVGWLVKDQGIEPHVAINDKAERTDGTFSRSDFTYDLETDAYTCPEGKILKARWRQASKPASVDADGQMKYRARKIDCTACPLKSKCCPNSVSRTVLRSIHEGARDLAREIADTDAGQASRRDRKKVERLFAHLKRILRLGRPRLRGPCGASDECLLAATAQNRRKLVKLRPKLEPTAALA